tara:strand:- start:24 stop:482 length:459 start_codon:yes stop_codon:yes gene_type:complete
MEGEGNRDLDIDMAKEKEFDDDSEQNIRYVVKDTQTAVKMRRAEAKEAASRYKAVIKRTNAESRLEIAKLKLQMTAKEAASKHIAIFGPLYLMLLVAGFLFSIQFIPAEQISVVSALLTLLITMIGSNLRSIVSEGNGDEENGHHKKKDDKK